MDAVDGRGQFRFGVMPEPFAGLNFEKADLSDVAAWWGRPQSTWIGRAVRRMRLKRWHYFSLCYADFFLCAALADVGCMGHSFCYLVDRRNGQKFETGRLFPLSLGLQVGAASQQASRTRGISVHFQDDCWHCALDLKLAGKPLRARWRMPSSAPLCLLYPLHCNRGAYTHKENASLCYGWLEWEGHKSVLDGSLGGLDYTCSYADRHTVWKWLFINGHLSDGRLFGINASACLYGSAENVLWLDGQLHVLGPVDFHIPVDGAWTITGEALEVSFHPLGQRCQDINLGVVRSAFRQPFGDARGALRVAGEQHEIGSAFGVAEDHEALW